MRKIFKKPTYLLFFGAVLAALTARPLLVCAQPGYFQNQTPRFSMGFHRENLPASEKILSSTPACDFSLFRMVQKENFNPEVLVSAFSREGVVLRQAGWFCPRLKVPGFSRFRPQILRI